MQQHLPSRIGVLLTANSTPVRDFPSRFTSYRSGSGADTLARATERKPGPSAGEFRFDPIGSRGSASTWTDAPFPREAGASLRWRETRPDVIAVSEYGVLSPLRLLRSAPTDRSPLSLRSAAEPTRPRRRRLRSLRRAVRSADLATTEEGQDPRDRAHRQCGPTAGVLGSAQRARARYDRVPIAHERSHGI